MRKSSIVSKVGVERGGVVWFVRRYVRRLWRVLQPKAETWMNGFSGRNSKI
jgi:hypothetical protein